MLFVVRLEKHVFILDIYSVINNWSISNDKHRFLPGVTDRQTVRQLVATVTLLCLFLVDGRALMLIVNFCILIRKRKKVILCICMHSGRTFFLPYVWALYSSCIVAVWGLDRTPLDRVETHRDREREDELTKTNKWIIWCNYWYGILIFWVPLFS